MGLKIKALVAVLAAIGALVTVSSSAALTKQTTIFPLDFVSVIPAGDLCSFPVTVEQGPGLIKIDDFFGVNGQPVKTLVTNYGGAFRESFSANGTTLRTVQTFADKITYNPDGSIAGIADAGINQVITLPHEGVVYQQVGRVVYDANFNVVFAAGPGLATPPDDAALCEALSG